MTSLNKTTNFSESLEGSYNVWNNEIKDFVMRNISHVMILAFSHTFTRCRMVSYTHAQLLPLQNLLFVFMYIF